MSRRHALTALVVAASTGVAPLEAHELNSRLSVGGVLANTVQCERISARSGSSDDCQASLPIQPALALKPGDRGEAQVKLGFAVGNGLNVESPLAVAPWAADLEDDVRHVNGRSRSHLLTAWYRHQFAAGQQSSLHLTFGIIDATDYLDQNAYANDEYTQFMNSALVNGPNVFLPSYDAGMAVEWERAAWSVRAVYMHVGENDDGNPYDFVAAQLGYRLETSFGEGNYRLLFDGTSRQFFDVGGESNESRLAILASCDQEIGKIVRAFIRLGWQSDAAAVDYAAIYSGGIDLKGDAWGRADDNIGIGLAYLEGGNLDIENTAIAETYYRWALNPKFGITADLQYLRDRYRGAGRVDGFVLGLRLAAAY